MKGLCSRRLALLLAPAPRKELSTDWFVLLNSEERNREKKNCLFIEPRSHERPEYKHLPQNKLWVTLSPKGERELDSLLQMDETGTHSSLEAESPIIMTCFYHPLSSLLSLVTTFKKVNFLILIFFSTNHSRSSLNPMLPFLS